MSNITVWMIMVGKRTPELPKIIAEETITRIRKFSIDWSVLHMLHKLLGTLSQPTLFFYRGNWTIMQYGQWHLLTCFSFQSSKFRFLCHFIIHKAAVTAVPQLPIQLDINLSWGQDVGHNFTNTVLISEYQDQSIVHQFLSLSIYISLLSRSYNPFFLYFTKQSIIDVDSTLIKCHYFSYMLLFAWIFLRIS